MQNCKQSLKVVPKVYKGLQSSLVSLAWLWSGRSLPKRGTSESAGAQCGQAPSCPTTNYFANPKSDRLTFFHMAGWLANCSWLAGYLTKCQPDPPQAETSCDKVCYYFGSDVPPGRDILWSSIIILQVRFTFGKTFGSGWPLVRCTPRQRHLVAKCNNTSDQVYLFIGG